MCQSPVSTVCVRDVSRDSIDIRFISHLLSTVGHGRSHMEGDVDFGDSERVHSSYSVPSRIWVLAIQKYTKYQSHMLQWGADRFEVWREKRSKNLSCAEIRWNHPLHVILNSHHQRERLQLNCIIEIPRHLQKVQNNDHGTNTDSNRFNPETLLETR